MPVVSHLLLYPIKSLDAQAVESATVLPSGALAGDRSFALVDEAGVFVTCRNEPRLHRLRARYEFARDRLELLDGEIGRTASFPLRTGTMAVAAWLGVFLGKDVKLVADADVGFPDDLVSPGPTVISTATLREIAGWFDVTLEDARARFRANIEIDGVPAFWEDRLFGADDRPPPLFHIGSASFRGIKPCQRCIVPTRDPRSGALDPQFAKRFGKLREQTLPPWTERARFPHFYHVAVNTRRDPGRDAMFLRVGDRLFLDGA